MTLPDATSTLATSSLLRPFRFAGLAVEEADAAAGTRSGEATSCDVLLALDFAGRARASLEERLRDARKRIGRDGVLLLAVPNRFGLRFWAGCPEPATGQLFATLSAQASHTAGKKGPFVSRHELALALDRAGFAALEWYYAVPDAQETGTSGSLLSERLVAAAPDLVADLAWARPSADRLRPRIHLFAEALVGRELARAGLFPEFASHFLVAAARKTSSAATSIWQRLRPLPSEAGWHFASGRREPIETLFELAPEGIAVVKRRQGGAPPASFGAFQWMPAERTLLASGEPLRLRLQSHLAAGCGPAFFAEFDAFLAATATRFQFAGENGRDRFSGEALDALVTNATRTSDGAFHFFDLEWCAPAGVPASWWILRNVAACLEMLGPRLPRPVTGSGLYALLCERSGVPPRLEEDLAREAGFAAAVRCDGGNDPLALAKALERPWPGAMTQGLDVEELRSATQLATEHHALVAAYRELESWALAGQQRATDAENQYRILEGHCRELEEEAEALRDASRQVSARAAELEARLLRQDLEESR